MGLFGKKKKEEEIPELPDLPSVGSNLPDLPFGGEPASPPGLNVEVNELPSLPKDDKGFGGGVIKQAIEHPEDKSFVPSISKPEPIRAEPVPMVPHTIEEPIKRTKKVEPIYVRLDKFEITVESFEEIRRKIMEIEKLLGKIKEMKNKEERELEEWEQEIQSIKARIDYIDKSIFNKLD